MAVSWAAVTAYLLHNVEEYGIDLFGRRLGFPDGFCALLNQPALPECPIPPLFFMAVNLPLFWVAAPIAASLSRRHTLVGLALYGVIIVNACLHIVPFVAGGGYSSGTLTAIVLFVPLSAWLGRTCFGPGRMGYRTLVLLIVLGVIGHALLMAPLQMFLHGWISERALVFSQFVNPIVLLLAPWLWNDRTTACFRSRASTDVTRPRVACAARLVTTDGDYARFPGSADRPGAPARSREAPDRLIRIATRRSQAFVISRSWRGTSRPWLSPRGQTSGGLPDTTLRRFGLRVSYGGQRAWVLRIR